VKVRETESREAGEVNQEIDSSDKVMDAMSIDKERFVTAKRSRARLETK